MATPTSTSPPTLTVLISGSGTNLQALLTATTVSTITSSSPSPNSPTPLLPARITHIISNRRDALGLTRAATHRATHPRDRDLRLSYHNLRAYRLAVDQERGAAAEGLAGAEVEGGGGGEGVGPQSREDEEAENQLRNQLARSRYDADLAALILGTPLLHAPSSATTTSALPPTHPAYTPPPSSPSPAPPTHKAPDLIVLAGFMHILSPAFLDPIRRATPPSFSSSVSGASGVPILNLHPALPGMYDGANALTRAWQDWAQGATVVVPEYLAEGDGGRDLGEGAGEQRSGASSSPPDADDWSSGTEEDDGGRALRDMGDGRKPQQRRKKKRREKISYTGAMVHHVISEVDRGQPVLVRKVDFREGESREEFETRFRRDENELMVDAVRVFLAGHGRSDGDELMVRKDVLGERAELYL